MKHEVNAPYTLKVREKKSEVKQNNRRWTNLDIEVSLEAYVETVFERKQGLKTHNIERL